MKISKRLLESLILKMLKEDDNKKEQMNEIMPVDVELYSDENQPEQTTTKK